MILVSKERSTSDKTHTKTMKLLHNIWNFIHSSYGVILLKKFTLTDHVWLHTLFLVLGSPRFSSIVRDFFSKSVATFGLHGCRLSEEMILLSPHTCPPWWDRLTVSFLKKKRKKMASSICLMVLAAFMQLLLDSVHVL